MSLEGDIFPRFRAISDYAVLAEFGEKIDETAYLEVIRLDKALAAKPFEGFAEAVPAYVSLLVVFNPVVTDHATIEKELRSLSLHSSGTLNTGATREVKVCYDHDLAPDLQHVATATGLQSEQVIQAHLAGDYRVIMYGFAPGYAYLGGVSKTLQLPRKPSAIRDVAAGSVLIAAGQCLVTTLKMPTGWWIIGRSPTRILTGKESHPFLFDVADQVAFKRIKRDEYETAVKMV